MYWGYDYGHGYGHRKGRGNRWDHEIDDIILDYMVEVDEIYHYYFDTYQIWRFPHQHHQSVKHSQSELAKVVRVQKGREGVSWDTIIGHLNILEKEHVVVNGRESKDHVIRRLPERGRNNEIYYSLSIIKYGERKPLVKV